jgi:tetratricopeptide (TPR) repeat protein
MPQNEENDIPKVMNAAQYVDYGNKKYYTGHYESARECFKRAAKQEPSSEAGKQAKIFLRSLVPRYPVTAEAEYKRNCAWQTLHDKGMEAAIPMFEACTKAYPKFEMPFYDLACIYLDSKNTGLAVGYAAKALAINPEYSNAWLAIGNARLIERKYPAAKNSAEKALQCNPYNHNAQKMLAYIRERMH